MDLADTLSLVLLLLSYALDPHEASEDTSQWLSIDCGASSWYLDDNLVSWDTDDMYISTGANVLVSSNKYPRQMNTLRFFPSGARNCYSLPVSSEDRVVLRAGFYYGNYDSLSKPPAFDLQFEGSQWATVWTSLDEEPIYHEVMFRPKGGSISLCLLRRGDGGVPFISSLEVAPIPSDLYRELGGNLAFYLRARADLGGEDDTSYEYLGYESYNRIWKAEGMPDYANISDFFLDCLGAENDPPVSVVATGIEAFDASESIIVTIELPETSQTAAIILYFFESNNSRSCNDSRMFSIYIDGHGTNRTVYPRDNECDVVTFYPVAVSGPTNVTLFPVQGSTLPPILNAMEVFTTIKLGDVSGSARDANQCKPSSLPLLLLISILSVVVVVV